MAKKLFLIIIIIIIVVIPGIGCTKDATIVTYREKIVLPTGSTVLTIQLQDVSRADAPAVIIGEQIINNPGQVPIPFEIKYISADIDNRNTYAIFAKITVDKQLWFITATSHQVMTRDYPSDIEVVMEKVN